MWRNIKLFTRAEQYTTKNKQAGGHMDPQKKMKIYGYFCWIGTCVVIWKREPVNITYKSYFPQSIQFRERNSRPNAESLPSLALLSIPLKTKIAMSDTNGRFAKCLKMTAGFEIYAFL